MLIFKIFGDENCLQMKNVGLYQGFQYFASVPVVSTSLSTGGTLY